MLGFTWPAAPDSTAKDDYELRLQAAYGELYKGYGNVYDATYDLMYAVAAVRGPITGSSIAAGMVRVTSGTEVATVGPGPEMSDNITLLATDASYKLRLVGTQGPPNWDDTGARMDAASVWCVDELGNYFPNALLYNPDTQQLEGTFPCFTFPAQ
jgi:hypothetical protein